MENAHQPGRAINHGHVHPANSSMNPERLIKSQILLEMPKATLSADLDVKVAYPENFGSYRGTRILSGEWESVS
ncbi:GM15590 [Drosophila sechellia]|uniref:GM15590 n=1 Tax=Drosophila sechellia TaxID=7238 RepID=B4I8F3_DROSE|nr:GM15590 [Drosophila sechellia]